MKVGIVGAGMVGSAELFPELDPAEHAALHASARLLRDLVDAVAL